MNDHIEFLSLINCHMLLERDQLPRPLGCDQCHILESVISCHVLQGLNYMGFSPNCTIIKLDGKQHDIQIS
jgi:hypothetical protein